MDPLQMLALASAVFLVTHCVSSTPLRAGLVGAIGERAYLGLYVAVSFATLGWMIWAFAHAPLVRLWAGEEFRAWAILLMPAALVLIACGAMTRNPSAVGQARALEPSGEAHGILRVTRHPIMWGIAIWALLHTLARGDSASVIFFGSFFVLALGGVVLIDRRKKRTLGIEWRRFASVTSNLPFGAIIAGRNQFRFEEIGWLRVLVGLAAYLILVLLHPHLFGVRAF